VGEALFTAVCGHRLEGVVAKRLSSRYARGWIKTKNPDYWRRDLERDAMVRSRTRSRLVGTKLDVGVLPYPAIFGG
jgi:ATP-dependent DNA ligase